MGTGSGVSGLNSRVFTNSYSSKVQAMAFPFRNKGDSFAGLSKPQYSNLIYYTLAASGSGAGGRGGRWALSQGVTTQFIPPKGPLFV
jgi:hypothetical protein